MPCELHHINKLNTYPPNPFLGPRVGNHITQSYKVSETPPRQLQVVDLACGFDGRAFRLNFPANTLFWELDRDEVLELKNRRIVQLRPIPQPTCFRRICVPADLIRDVWEEKLIDKGEVRGCEGLCLCVLLSTLSLSF